METPKGEPYQMTGDMEHYRAYGSERLLSSLDSLTAEIKGVKEEEDIEFVHRMRVASRRLRAALMLFGECFDEDDAKKWNRAVRGVTRELGAARDLDVQISFLEEFMRDHQGYTTLDALLAELEIRRAEAQPRIVEALEKLEGKKILEEMKRTYKEVRSAPRCSIPYGTMERAFHHIMVRLDELLSLEDCVHSPLEKERQHEMRIAAKRLRYTMEAFQELYGDPLKDRISITKDIQDRLGELHDCDAWIDMLQKRSISDEGTNALVLDRMEARTQIYGEFVKIWDALIEEGFFSDLLNTIVPDVVQISSPMQGLTSLEHVRAVAKGCGVDEEHYLHVANLSVMLYDDLRSLHGLGDRERELLEFAAILHDIGWKMGRKNHHKTSLEMIMAEDRLPLDDREKAIVANVARYHRGALPEKKQKSYVELEKADRSVVDRLASIIRIADALDVSHTSVVTSVKCEVKKNSVIFLLATKGFPDRELDKASEKKDLFMRTFNKTPVFQWER